MRAVERYRGSLLGLAVGDALGTAVEFRPPGSFPPVTGMRGGGSFHLAPGQWTDDTSMALCLAESLVERRTFDPVDQLERYVRWYRDGHMSSTGACFDIGRTTAEALRRFEHTREPYCGPTGPRTAGNGSLMRLAPVPLAYAQRPKEAIRMAAAGSRTTHGALEAVDACRYLAALIVGAVRGASRDELLVPGYEPAPGLWESEPLAPKVAEVAAGSFKVKDPPAIRGTGYSVECLEAALWAFHRGGSFREGALLAVNLGDDADTTGAVYGQLAGAYYGEKGIPAEWRERVAKRELIESLAEGLRALATGGAEEEGPGLG